jgi:hypothetical protein
MKKMRKLIPAFAMLMIAAIMMSTASYAWFSMSTTATATGMQVQAKADAGILISDGKGAWASSAQSTQADVAKLLPVSTKDGSQWFYTTSDNAASVNANSAQGTYTTFAKTTETGSYYLYNAFYIKSSSNEALNRDIMVSGITITESADLDLNEAVRVLVICNDVSYIYSPSERTYQVLKTPKTGSSDNVFESVTSKADAETGLTDNFNVTSIPNVTVDAAGAVKVEVYVYFEGEDANCYSNNLKDAVATMTVDITFSLK